MCVYISNVTKSHKKKNAGSLFIHLATRSNSTEKLILIKALIRTEYEEIHNNANCWSCLQECFNSK